MSTYIRLVGIAGEKKVDKNHLNTFLYWVFTSLWLSIHRFLLIWLMSRMQIQWKTIGSIGGSKGGRQGRAPPPGGPNSFNFMQFWGENGQIIASFRVGAPSSGKSWIRHWVGCLQLSTTYQLYRCHVEKISHPSLWVIARLKTPCVKFGKVGLVTKSIIVLLHLSCLFLSISGCFYVCSKMSYQ